MNGSVLAFLAAAFYFGSSFAQQGWWEVLSPYPAPGGLKSVTFGAGVFVAAGEEALIYSENSGASWQMGTNFARVDYKGVVYGNGRFVAVGTGGAVGVSDSGRNWSMYSSSQENDFITVSFGNGIFVGTTLGGTVARSSDGKSWETIDGLTNLRLRMNVFGNGLFLVGATEERGGDRIVPRFWTSSDGKDWSSFEPEFPENYDVFLDIASKVDSFLAQVLFKEETGVSTKTFISRDGRVWEKFGGSGPTPEAWNGEDALSYVNGRLIYFPKGNGNERGFWTIDAVNWTPFTIPENSTAIGDDAPVVAFGNSSYVVAGTGNFHQFNLGPMLLHGGELNQLQRVDGPNIKPGVNSVAAAGSTIVAIPGGFNWDPQEPSRPTTFLVSTNDGETFFEVEIPNDPISGQPGGAGTVLHAQGKFLAVGSGIFQSLDGINWSRSTSNASHPSLLDLTFGKDIWVAVGRGTIVSSGDGHTFELQASPTVDLLNAVGYGNGMFVAVSDTGFILASEDGVNWTIYYTEEGEPLRGVAYGNGMWIVSGGDGLLYTSSNGIDWARQTSTPVSLSDIAVDNGVFAAVGKGGQVYLSSDGMHWRGETLVQPLHGAEASDGKLWITGASAYIARFIRAPDEIRLNGTVNGDGKFSITISVPRAGTYQLQAKADLSSSNWQTAETLEATGGQISWVDPSPVQGTRFYRAVGIDW